MRKRVAVIASFVALLVVAAACSSSGGVNAAGGGGGGGTSGTFTFASGGGANQDAFAAACVTPFAKMHHLKPIEADAGGGLAKLEVMQKAGDVTWNIMDDAVQDPGAGNWSSVLTPINYNIVDKSLAPPLYFTKYGVGHDVFALVMVYNKKTYGSNPPRTLADFFNTKKYPGKRAFPSVQVDGPAVSSEMVDAAATGQFPPTYPLDRSKMFNLLSSVQNDLSIYTSSSQAEQLFESGQVNLGIIYASHISDLLKAHMPVAAQWNQNVSNYEHLEIPKGAPNQKLDMEFMNYCLSKEAQVKYTEALPNGPVNPKATAALPNSVSRFLSVYPAHAKVGFQINQKYWTPSVTDTFTKAWQQWELGG